ncbi:MAG: hypothetical protein WAQ98_14540 [Blastocatellia bacterium]
MTNKEIERLVEFILKQQIESEAKDAKWKAEWQARQAEQETKDAKWKAEWQARQAEQETKDAKWKAEWQARQAEHDVKVDRQIEFLLEQQASHESDIQEVRQSIDKLAKTVDAMAVRADEERQEIREAIEALITNSEDIRNITKQLATAVIGINKRVTKLENKDK